MGRFSKAATGMSLAEHLAEIRHRFFVVTISVFVFGVVSFLLYAPILEWLQHPYCTVSASNCKFLITNPLDGLSLRIKISVYGGMIFSLPIIFWQAWRFINPGLKKNEKKYIIPFVIAAVIFFVIGMVVAYLSFGHALAFLQAVGGNTLITQYNPNQYLSLITLMLFAFGLTFEFPVFLVALQLAGAVTPKTLLHNWRYACIGITIASAVFTPSGDPLSMCALAVPLVVFYFGSIGVGKLFRK
jgi:sec-independent protein translocase protein TatC